MKRPFWVNPVTGLIVGFLVLSFLDGRVLPHLLVVVLNCAGALAVVIWLQARQHTNALPASRIKEILEEEISFLMGGVGVTLDAERDALIRVKNRIDFEEVGR